MWKTWKSKVIAFKKKIKNLRTQESPRQEKTKVCERVHSLRQGNYSLGMHGKTTETFNPSVLKAALSLATSP